MLNKKAQDMNAVGVFVMGIVVVAMILAIGLIILGQFNTAISTDLSGSASNETLAFTNVTAMAVAKTACISDISVSALYNDSGNTIDLVGDTNVTIATSEDTVTVTDDSGQDGAEYVGANLYADYSCNVGTVAYNATNTNVTKLATIPTWIGILITVALAFIVLGYFYKRQ